MTKIDINYEYPMNPDYTYEATLKRIDLDKERKKDLLNDNGFIISEPQSIKKDLKDPNGIFSTKYGPTLRDLNPFADKYKCDCGMLKSRINHNMKCQTCGTLVRYVDDDFGYFGWCVLKDPFYIIHPNLYKSLEFLIGDKKFNKIIEPVDEKNEDGHSIERDEEILTDKYSGLGIIGFKERFDEIVNYYYSKAPNKKEYYDDIMKNRDIIFTQSIPVFTTLLRPFDVDGNLFSFEATNPVYNLTAKLVSSVNKDSLHIYRKKKNKNLLLYDIQFQYNKLYKEIESILSHKKGIIRGLFGGRYTFSARAVIISDPKLKIDQVTLPYHALVELLQQSIINILKTTYNTTYAEAYKIWYKAQAKKNDMVYEIIKAIIKDKPHGIPVLINRNPTISFGGILQMYCVGINDTFTMGIPLQVLSLLGADFDGDCLNILYILNKQFLDKAEEIFNPRNSMYISKNDGMFNNSVNHCKDTLINANSMIFLSRHNYTQEQFEKIERCKNYG